MRTQSMSRRIWSTGSKPLPIALLIYLTISLAAAVGCAGQQPAEKPSSAQDPSPSLLPSKPPETPTPWISQVASNLPTITTTPERQETHLATLIMETPDLTEASSRESSPAAWRPPVYPVPWIPSPQDHFYFVNPIAAQDIDGVHSNYGYGDVFFDNVVHTGIDIPGDIGTPVRAAGDGRVIYAGYGVYRGGNDIYDDPYGKAVVIKHDFSYQGEDLYTLYAHLNEITTQIGARVKAGDEIGLMGSTGKTTGPHLHFEVRLGKNDYFATRNPDLWISPPQGWGVLVGQVLSYEGRPVELQEVTLYALDNNAPPDSNKLWMGRSYQNEAINSDPFYKENLTISSIPAGTYLLQIPVTSIGYQYDTIIEINPGQVTFFKFNVWRGFTLAPPPTPTINFVPLP